MTHFWLALLITKLYLLLFSSSLEFSISGLFKPRATNQKRASVHWRSKRENNFWKNGDHRRRVLPFRNYVNSKSFARFGICTLLSHERKTVWLYFKVNSQESMDPELLKLHRCSERTKEVFIHNLVYEWNQYFDGNKAPLLEVRMESNSSPL